MSGIFDKDSKEQSRGRRKSAGRGRGAAAGSAAVTDSASGGSGVDTDGDSGRPAHMNFVSEAYARAAQCAADGDLAGLSCALESALEDDYELMAGILGDPFRGIVFSNMQSARAWPEPDHSLMRMDSPGGWYGLVSRIIWGNLYSWNDLTRLDAKFLKYGAPAGNPWYDWAYVTAMVTGCYVLTKSGQLCNDKGQDFAQAFRGWALIDELFERCEPYFGHSCGFYYLKALWFYLKGNDPLCLQLLQLASCWYRAEEPRMNDDSSFERPATQAERKKRDNFYDFNNWIGATGLLCRSFFNMGNSLIPEIRSALSRPQGQIVTAAAIISSFEEVVRPALKSCLKAAADGVFARADGGRVSARAAAAAAAAFEPLASGLEQWAASWCSGVQLVQISGSFIEGNASRGVLTDPVVFAIRPLPPGESCCTLIPAVTAISEKKPLLPEVQPPEYFGQPDTGQEMAAASGWSNGLRLILARHFAKVVNGALSRVMTMEVNDEDFADRAAPQRSATAPQDGAAATPAPQGCDPAPQGSAPATQSSAPAALQRCSQLSWHQRAVMLVRDRQDTLAARARGINRSEYLWSADPSDLSEVEFSRQQLFWHRQDSQSCPYGWLPGAYDFAQSRCWDNSKPWYAGGVRCPDSYDNSLYQVITVITGMGQFDLIDVTAISEDDEEFLSKQERMSRDPFVELEVGDYKVTAPYYYEVRRAIRTAQARRALEDEMRVNGPVGVLRDGEMPIIIHSCEPESSTVSLYELIALIFKMGDGELIDPDHRSDKELLAWARAQEDSKALLYRIEKGVRIDRPEYGLGFFSLSYMQIRQLIRLTRISRPLAEGEITLPGTEILKAQQRRMLGYSEDNIRRDQSLNHEDLTLRTGKYPGAPYVLSRDEEITWRSSGMALEIKDGRRVCSDAAVMDWLNMLILHYHGWRLGRPEDVRCPRRMHPLAWSSPLAAALQIEALSTWLPADANQLHHLLHPYHQEMAFLSGLSLHYLVIEYEDLLTGQAALDVAAANPGLTVAAAAAPAPAAAEAASGSASGRSPAAQAGCAELPDAALMLIRALGLALPPAPADAAQDSTTASKGGRAASSTDGHVAACRAASMDLKFTRNVTARQRTVLMEVSGDLSHDCSALYLGWTRTTSSLVLDFLVYDYDSFEYIADQWSRLDVLDRLNIRRITQCALAPCATPVFLYGQEAGRVRNSMVTVS